MYPDSVETKDVWEQDLANYPFLSVGWFNLTKFLPPRTSAFC